MKLDRFSKFSRIIFLFIIISAFFLRFNKLGRVPYSLSWDEVSLGYNAYSILTTGRDEHGKFLPITAFEAYGDYKPIGYIYSLIPFIKIFGLSEFSVRLPSALFGSLTVFLTYFLVKELFFAVDKKNTGKSAEFVALLSMLLLAISPWHLNLSRAGFEANLANFFVVGGLYFFLKAIHKKSYLFLISVVFFVLSIYTFNSARIFTPILGIVLLIVFYQTVWRKRGWMFASGIIILLFLAPLLPYLFSSQAKLRFQEVNIFTDLTPIETANKRIEIDDHVWWSNIVHNRRLLFALEIARHYFDNLNMNFLFINGDGNPKFSIRDVGQLYIWDLPFLVFGFYYLVKKKEGFWYMLILWLLIGIIPASVARETPHALRIENSLPSWQIITAYGFVVIAQLLYRQKRKFTKYIFLPSAFLILFLNFLFYHHNYYYSYPNEFAGEWQWGYREAIEKISSLEDKYDKVVITEKIGRPYMYVLFYKKYDPRKFWQEVDRTSDPYGLFNVHGFGKYIFGGNADYQNEKILYVQSPEAVKGGANVINKVGYPDGETALVIFD